VVTVLRLSGRNAQQVESLMARNALIGAMVNNITVCRDPEHQNKCVGHRQRLESELAMSSPLISEESWSNTETLDHVIAAAKSPVISTELRLAFSWATVSDPAELAQLDTQSATA
jgi:hypothetical protein